MDNHRWTNSALHLFLSVVASAALFGPIGANAQQCEANSQIGCVNANAVCEIEQKAGRCTSSANSPKGEGECSCVVPSEPAEVAITALAPTPQDCSSAESTISATLIKILGQFGIQNPDIRPNCVPASGGSSRLVVLIWSTPVSKNSPEDQARTDAQLPNVISGDGFALFITEGLMTRLARFNLAKTPSVPGYPHIHPKSLSLDFTGGSTIKTIVHGTDDQPTPSVDFTDTVTDKLGKRITPASGMACSPVSDPKCGCVTTSSVDTDVLGEIEVLAFLPFLGIDPVVTVNDFEAPSNHPKRLTGGAGCGFYQGLPDEIALPESNNPPQKMKLVITYLSVSEADSGVAFHASAKSVARAPAVQISGPSPVSFGYGASKTSAQYTVLPMPLQASDFYGPLTFEWSGDSQYVQIADPTKQNTVISFSGGDNMRPGASITRTINARVTDSEGSTATASFNIVVSKSRRKPPKPQ
jgi:hypothetical protein